jgi:hypothetical protein
MGWHAHSGSRRRVFCTLASNGSFVEFWHGECGGECPQWRSTTCNGKGAFKMKRTMHTHIITAAEPWEGPRPKSQIADF